MSFDGTCNNMVTLIREDHSGTITEISFCITNPKMKRMIFDNFLPPKKDSSSNESENISNKASVNLHSLSAQEGVENSICELGKSSCFFHFES